MDVIDFSFAVNSALNYGLYVTLFFALIGFGFGALIHIINRIS